MILGTIIQSYPKSAYQGCVVVSHISCGNGPLRSYLFRSLALQIYINQLFPSTTLSSHFHRRFRSRFGCIYYSILIIHYFAISCHMSNIYLSHLFVYVLILGRMPPWAAGRGTHLGLRAQSSEGGSLSFPDLFAILTILAISYYLGMDTTVGCGEGHPPELGSVFGGRLSILVISHFSTTLSHPTAACVFICESSELEGG